MKKIVLFLSMLLAMGLTCACSSDGHDTLEAPEEAGITAESFLAEKLSNTRRFLQDRFAIEENTCYRIDSKKEFSELYLGSDELPEIDFDKYTLILGAKVYTDADTDDEKFKQILSESDDSYILNLYSKHLEGKWSSCGITLQIFYFGLYPKLKEKKISVNLIYE